MPAIQVVLNQKVNENKKKNLVRRLTEDIAVIKGKTKEMVMVSVLEDCFMAFQGDISGLFADVTVRMFGSSEATDKQAYGDKVVNALAKEILINNTNVYITFQEMEEWYANGTLVHIG